MLVALRGDRRVTVDPEDLVLDALDRVLESLSNPA